MQIKTKADLAQATLYAIAELSQHGSKSRRTLYHPEGSLQQNPGPSWQCHGVVCMECIILLYGVIAS